jgi:glyoxylase-like metal-dependent hydrolase (beta-lactamase superfamily II)
MKNFVVSDIHDHYDLLIEALNRNGFDINNEDHRLIVCGDAFYSGPQPGELFVFLRELSEKGRLIFIYGNHDIELLDNLRAGKFTRPANRRCAALIVRYLTQKTELSDDELVSECENLGFTRFLSEVPVWYYENEGYVFTHGFIPTEKKAYKPDWRDATEKEWRNAAARGDAMALSMRYGISEPNKKIVCGHYSAARCYLMKNATPTEWENKIYKDVSKVPAEGFKPFFGDTFIAIDQSVKKTGFMNCIVIEE